MSDLATFSERGTITFVRYLPGPIERVWAFLTEPKLLATWFSDGTVPTRAGADVTFDMGASGRITIWDPPRVLEYTWNEEDASVGPVSDSLVRWELAEEGARVRLTLTHSRLPEDELLGHGAGWHAFLERLHACLDGVEPPPFESRFAQIRPQYANLFQDGETQTSANGEDHVS